MLEIEGFEGYIRFSFGILTSRGTFASYANQIILFVMHLVGVKLIVLIVYVDDMIYIGNCKEEMVRLSNYFSRNLKLRT